MYNIRAVGNILEEHKILRRKQHRVCLRCVCYLSSSRMWDLFAYFYFLSDTNSDLTRMKQSERNMSHAHSRPNTHITNNRIAVRLYESSTHFLRNTSEHSLIILLK